MSSQPSNSAIRKQLRRLTHIVSLLKCGDMSARELLRDLEASSHVPSRQMACCARTLRRAIAVLRSEYGCPVKYRASEHVYYLENRSWNFPGLLPSTVDKDEVLALILGAKFARDILPSTISHGVERTVDEILSRNSAGEEYLSQQRIKSLKILMNAGPVSEQVFHEVFDAWRSRHCLTIGYHDPKDVHKEYLIEPQALVFYDMQWGLKAFCPDDQKWRTFLLSRIEKAYETERKFKPDDRQIGKISADNYFQFPEIHGVTIRLNKAGKQYAEAHPLRKEQKIKSSGQGDFVLQVPEVSKEVAVRWMLSQASAGDALPLGPQVLVAEFKRQLKRLLEMCEAVETDGSVKPE